MLFKHLFSIFFPLFQILLYFMQYRHHQIRVISLIVDFALTNIIAATSLKALSRTNRGWKCKP